MKKISFVLLLLFALLTAGAQRPQLGIKGGVNLATIDDDRAPDNTKSRTGFHVGALAHIHLTHALALQPEVMYSSQGAEYSLTNYTGKEFLHYINVPVLLQYMFRGGFRLQTGPQLGFLTKAEFERAGSNTQVELRNLNDLDFSWTLGAGYLTTSGFGLDARYNYGISNLYESGSGQAKNRVWQFGIFYQFLR